MPGLDRVVLGREVEVGRAGNQDRARLDGAERAFEIAPVLLVGADVAQLPRVELGQQVVGVPPKMVMLPVDKQIRPGLEAELAVEPLTIEGL